jgi:hypothetical protein
MNLSSHSGFTYHEVTKANLHEYLDNETIEQINKTYHNSPHKKFEQIFSDFVRLALLAKHGGVYMDASFVLLQNLDWLVNITNYPQKYVYNRYGQQPKVLMFFNAQYGGRLFEAEVDSEHNTRRQWHLGYENNFIAAEAGNELIKEWYQEFVLYHTLEHSQIRLRYEECGLGNQAWETGKWGYLYEMDAVKCVLGRRNQQLLKANSSLGPHLAVKYYQLWSINGYNGVQKFRSFSNFENPESEDNVFATLYSSEYVSKVIGWPKELTKFFGLGGKRIALFLYSYPDKLDFGSLVNQHLMPYKAADEISTVYMDIPVLVRGGGR